MSSKSTKSSHRFPTGLLGKSNSVFSIHLTHLTRLTHFRHGVFLSNQVSSQDVKPDALCHGIFGVTFAATRRDQALARRINNLRRLIEKCYKVVRINNLAVAEKPTIYTIICVINKLKAK